MSELDDDGYDDADIYLSNFGVVTNLDGTLSVDKTRLGFTG